MLHVIQVRMHVITRCQQHPGICNHQTAFTELSCTGDSCHLATCSHLPHRSLHALRLCPHQGWHYSHQFVDVDEAESSRRRSGWTGTRGHCAQDKAGPPLKQKGREERDQVSSGETCTDLG